MEVCTAGALVAPDEPPDRALVLLRRVGVVVGLLFGLGFVALFVADHAAADAGGSPGVATQQDDSSVVGRLAEPLTKPLADGVVKPVADAVAGQVAPVAAAVAQPVVPVVRAGADLVAPVVRPVVDAVASVTAPVLRPVVAAVGPVLEPVVVAVAPVTEPSLTPVLDAAEPVVKPVTDATGLTPVTDAVSGARSQDGLAPVDRALPAPSEVPSPAWSAASTVTRVVREVTVDAWDASGATSVEPVHMASGSPGPPPGLPSSPVQLAVTGGGVAGGMGGSHGGGTAVVGGSAGVVGQWTSSGRSPPGTIVGTAWFGYDDRDHPS
jgi:hypothetical protein